MWCSLLPMLILLAVLCILIYGKNQHVLSTSGYNLLRARYTGGHRGGDVQAAAYWGGDVVTSAYWGSRATDHPVEVRGKSPKSWRDDDDHDWATNGGADGQWHMERH